MCIGYPKKKFKWKWFVNPHSVSKMWQRLKEVEIKYKHFKSLFRLFVFLNYRSSAKFGHTLSEPPGSDHAGGLGGKGCPDTGEYIILQIFK